MPQRTRRLARSPPGGSGQRQTAAQTPARQELPRAWMRRQRDRRLTGRTGTPRTGGCGAAPRSPAQRRRGGRSETREGRDEPLGDQWEATSRRAAANGGSGRRRRGSPLRAAEERRQLSRRRPSRSVSRPLLPHSRRAALRRGACPRPQACGAGFGAREEGGGAAVANRRRERPGDGAGGGAGAAVKRAPGGGVGELSPVPVAAVRGVAGLGAPCRQGPPWRGRWPARPWTICAARSSGTT